MAMPTPAETTSPAEVEGAIFMTKGGRVDFQAVSLPPHLSSETALKEPEIVRNARYRSCSRAWQEYLESCGVNTSKFGTGGTKTMSWLFQARERG